MKKHALKHKRSTASLQQHAVMQLVHNRSHCLCLNQNTDIL